MKRLTQPLRTSLLALAVLAAIVLDGVLWGPGFGRKAGRFSQWPMDVPAQAFTDWQDREGKVPRLRGYINGSDIGQSFFGACYLYA